MWQLFPGSVMDGFAMNVTALPLLGGDFFHALLENDVPVGHRHGCA